MDSVYNEQEDYYGKCGEIFLTVKGDVVFHCTLCENIYKNFQEYNDHILESHYALDNDDKLTTDLIYEEDNSFDIVSEDGYALNELQFITNDEEAETYEPPEQIVDSRDAPDEDFNEESQAFNEESQAINEESEAFYEENDDESVELAEDISTTICDLSKKEIIRAQLKCINVKPTITNRKYKCPHCGFKGADKSNMLSHIRRHSMNKPHQCSECSKTFHTRTELKTHFRSHTGERPFLCTLCGRAFTTASQLSTHQKTHSNIRDKECSICKMRFCDQKRLRIHMVVHSDKRSFKCDKCDASFKVSMGLKNHMKLHENKRAYQCKLCDSRFNQNAGLYSHMKNCHTVVFNSTKMPSKNENEN